MEWEIEHTNEFEDWWRELKENEQDDTASVVELLSERGPQLDHPFSSKIEGSKHNHMRELRIQSGGKPIRVFYAFNPARTAILLIGGDKTGDNRFYDKFIPVADKLYDTHLDELRKEGLI